MSSDEKRDEELSPEDRAAEDTSAGPLKSGADNASDSTARSADSADRVSEGSGDESSGPDLSRGPSANLIQDFEEEPQAQESGASDQPEPEASGDGGDDGSDPSAGELAESDDSGSEDDESFDDEELPEMTFTSHLEELRVRMTRMVIGALVGFLACFGIKERLFDMLLVPLKEAMPPGSKLIYTGLPEAFFTYLKVALVAGIFAASPYIFYQIWAFVAPGLYKDERKWIIPIAFFSALFFCTGAAFGYFVVFPFAFEFFMEFATDTILPMPSLKEYLSFSLKLLFAFGLVFELPLFIFFLARLGLVDAPLLRRIRKYAILCTFIFSAVLTPPDVVSQCLMAGPVIVLYELSIIIAWMFGKKRQKDEDDDYEEDENEEDSEENASSTA